MTHPLLPFADRALHLLGDASLLLARAANSADADRFSFSPLSVFAGPLKYWRWHKAKKLVAQAAAELDSLRAQRRDVPDASDAAIDISQLDAINDLFDVLPFSVRLNGTPGGPSRIKQNIGMETTVYHRIETARLGVDHLMSEVGLLHKRLRGEAAARVTS